MMFDVSVGGQRQWSSGVDVAWLWRVSGSSGMYRSMRWLRRATSLRCRSSADMPLVPGPTQPNMPVIGLNRLVQDALEIVTAVGHGERRFHLVDHDCAASLAWQIAEQQRDRLASPAILSRPHPWPFARALKCRMANSDGGPGTITHIWSGMLVRTSRRKRNSLQTRLIANALLAVAIEAHLSVIGNPSTMEAALVISGAVSSSCASGADSANPVQLGRSGRRGWEVAASLPRPHQFVALPGVGPDRPASGLRSCDLNLYLHWQSLKRLRKTSGKP